MATERELLASRIVLRAVLPVIKVMLEDDPATARRFQGVNAKVQFTARDAQGEACAVLNFSNEGFSVTYEPVEDPDLAFRFSSIGAMNAFFGGKTVLPRISGWTRFGLLIKVVLVLLGLKILLPTAKPKSPEQARLKVKMTLYMVSTALSQMNKAGDPEMVKWTSKQPERVYQWSCEPEGIACYLRVKAGKTQAGRGYYTRRKPFVHMRFNGVSSALPVLANAVGTVQAITQGLIDTEGSPEYAGRLGDFMLKVADLLE